MTFAYLLLFLLPLAAIAYILWDHRRKRASREAASASRIEELIAVSVNATPPDPASPTAGDAESTTPPVAAASASLPTTSTTENASGGATIPAAYALRERLLSPPQTLLYYLLRTTLPDYLIFAQTPVASVIEPGAGLAAYAREEQARIFARHVVDFVIVDKGTRPVAVMKLVATTEALQQGSLSLMRTWFATVGVRYVELDPAALPRKDAVRALVLGDAEARENNASNNIAAP